jgi:hypothetical protein
MRVRCLKEEGITSFKRMKCNDLMIGVAAVFGYRSEQLFSRCANMQFPHWLMTGGALLVLFGLVGTAFQRKRAASDPSRSEPGELTDGQAVSLPKFLE